MSDTIPQEISERKCTACERTKPLTEFYASSRIREDGTKIYQSQCKVCVLKKQKRANFSPERLQRAHDKDKSRNRKNQRRNRKTQRRQHLKSHYGITLEQYEEMLKQQNHVCAICENPETWSSPYGLHHSLSVDHNHKTGKIRGLLCNKCNMALGKFEEKLEQTLKRAAPFVKYLERYQ